MNQINIKVTLLEKDGEDVLSFLFDEEEGIIELNSDSFQEQMKKVFSNLLKLTLENDVLLDFVVCEGYTRGLYKEVCEEYIKDLQEELDKIKDKIRKEMNIS